MRKILVLGATGFLGGRLARGLLAEGNAVRCLARTPSKAEKLAAAGCEIVQGDMGDLASVVGAVEGVEAVYVTVHTLSAQLTSAPGQGFMDVERKGLDNIVAACRAHGVHRLIYVTSLGVTAEATNTWVRGRWAIEQSLFKSGLDVTVIRPGQIVGRGGHGFDMMVAQARNPVVLNLFSGGGMRMRTIAVDDLVYYLVGVLDDPRAYGHPYDVGNDEVLSANGMTDVAASVLGRRPPIKFDMPRSLLRWLAPQIERRAKLPKGAIEGMIDGAPVDLDGDPMPIRAILPRPLLTYRQAVEQALKEKV